MKNDSPTRRVSDSPTQRAGESLTLQLGEMESPRLAESESRLLMFKRKLSESGVEKSLFEFFKIFQQITAL
jgi:hypothetical protein